MCQNHHDIRLYAANGQMKSPKFAQMHMNRPVTLLRRLHDHALIIGASGGIGSPIVQALTGQGGWRSPALSRAIPRLDVTDEASVQRRQWGAWSRVRSDPCATGALLIDGRAEAG